MSRVPCILQDPLWSCHQSQGLKDGSNLISGWAPGSSFLKDSSFLVNTTVLIKWTDAPLTFSSFILLLALWTFHKRILLMTFYFPLTFFTVQLRYSLSTHCSTLQSVISLVEKQPHFYFIVLKINRYYIEWEGFLLLNIFFSNRLITLKILTLNPSNRERHCKNNDALL